jgi:hypothetical protein
MRRNKLKSVLIATASAGALFVGLNIEPAMATPIFTINPNALPGISGYTPQVESDYNGSSDALIQQTGPTTQMEVGWVQGQSFTNNGGSSNFTTTGMLTEPGISNTYNIYILYQATINGISGFTPGQSGTIAPGGFTYEVLADDGDNDVFAAGTPGANGGTDPSVTGVAPADIVLAVGYSLAGSAGFQSVTGAPTFDVVSTFILCDGTPGEGLLGGVTVTTGAADCGSFNSTAYFTNPNPFYNVALDSTTAGSASNFTPFVGSLNPGAPPNGTLNGIVADVNFETVPEPSTLLMFGFGMLGLGFLARRRNKFRA